MTEHALVTATPASEMSYADAVKWANKVADGWHKAARHQPLHSEDADSYWLAGSTWHQLARGNRAPATIASCRRMAKHSAHLRSVIDVLVNDQPQHGELS